MVLVGITFICGSSPPSLEVIAGWWLVASGPSPCGPLHAFLCLGWFGLPCGMVAFLRPGAPRETKKQMEVIMSFIT